MRIVVSGATGFLGGHIVDELARHDVELVALVRPGSRRPRPSAAGVAVVEADAIDRDALRSALTGATFVVNAVRLTTPGLRDDEYDAVNVGSVTNLLDACVSAGVQGFVHLSSAGMYGDSFPRWPVDESWAFRPVGPADRSRATAERAARTYRRRIPLVVLRPAHTFGPRDNGVIQRVLLHFLNARRPRLIAGGAAPVSMVYAPDLGRAVWSVLEHFNRAQDKIFHVKTFDSDWRTVLEEICALRQRRPRYLSLPYRLASVVQQLGVVGDWALQAPIDSERYLHLVGRPHLVDDSHLRSTTGYEPLFGLRTALRQTLEWIVQDRPDVKL